MAIVAIIPARFASTRLPGKPLSVIHGKTMIQRVHERASAARTPDRVVVATDDERIAAVVRGFGGEAVLTSPDHPTGTDRLAEAARGLEAEIVVNVQGDEPMLDPAGIDAAVGALVDDPSLPMATLSLPLRSVEEMLAPSVVKVVVDAEGNALYFSRSPIPHVRRGTASDLRAAAEAAVSGALAPPPGVALLIFLLCAASFAVVLTLGGGPRATTLEVAIYQSLRADFDPQRAAALAMVQLALCAALALLAQRFGGLMPGLPAPGRRPPRFDGQARIGRSADIAVIAMGLLLLLPPLTSLVASGLANITSSPALLRASTTSLAIGIAAASVAFAFAWALASAAARSSTWSRTAQLAVLAAWIVPPAVLATGWFIALRGAASSTGLAAALVIGMNALMALPFAYQTLAPAMAAAARRHDRLCANLGIAGWNRFRRVDLPSLRRPALLGLMMAFIVALGDLTAIALFGSQDLVTLPALIYRQMGSYRFDEAAGTALVLALLVLALVTLAERWSAQHD